MKRHAKRKSTKAHTARRSRQHPARAKARPLKIVRAAKARQPASASRPRDDAAIQGLQDAVASLSDSDLIEILSDLSWPNRAKWLSSYFTGQLPGEFLTDDDDAADAFEDISAQVAVLLGAMAGERPTDYLSAVTHCFSADPSHIEAGLAWLDHHLGTRAIDLDALEGLPGYQAVAEIMERARGQ